MLDVFAVDLSSSRLFETWFLQATASGHTPSEVVKALSEVNSAPATIRALTVSYWRALPEYDALLKRCFSLGDPVAAEIAKGYAIYRRSLDVIQAGGSNLRSRLSEMQGALEWSMKVLANAPHSDLAVEAQIGTLVPLCALATINGEHENAVQMASQGLYLAEQLQAPITIARMRARLIDHVANAGRTVDTVAMVQEDRKQGFRYGVANSEIQLADALFSLGNFDEAVHVLTDLIDSHTGERQTRGLEYMQRMEAFWGVGGLEGSIYATPRGSMPTQWITEACRQLMRAHGTPRENKSADLRARHFQRAIEACRLATGLESPWAKHFTQWATVAAHLGRGEFTDAAGIIEHVEDVYPEWLDIRALLFGAALELSLSWLAPEGCSTARHEQQLRAVFVDAARTRFASATGLARLLHRWHPVAAAYLALAPNPVLACAAATRSVLKVGARNFACDDLGVPPVMACDLLLRALDFDLRRDFIFVQGDAGAQRVKGKRLLQQSGAVPVWRLPVSSVKLAYGLMRHQSAEYHDRATSLIQTYGIRPTTSALYPMIGVLDDVERHTRALLDGHLTTKGFAAAMSSIGS